MKTFTSTYVNPRRRDLLRQLAAIGAIGAGGITRVVLAAAQEKDTDRNSLSPQSTWRDASNYDEVRKAMLWRSNTPDRYPDVIVQAKTVEEVSAALRFAMDNDLQVVCRASGHNTAAAILRNGGMMLDISGMNGISVDPDARTASIQPGVRMAQLFQELESHDLAFPIADCHTVALGGYLLGGGLGLNLQHWGQGPACYSILDADVILADGNLVTVNATNHPDIYWAIRGIGPGFFGVVTRFTLRVYDYPGTIISNSYIHPIDALPDINAMMLKLDGDKDERLTTSVLVYPSTEQGGALVAHVMLMAIADPGGDPDAEARAMLAPYVDGGIARGNISADEYKVIPMSEKMFTPDRNERANTDNINTDDADALPALLGLASARPPNSNMYLSFRYGGQGTAFRDDACYSAAGKHHLGSRLKWYNPDDDAANDRWYREFNDILEPYAVSHSINEIDNENHPERVRNCFTPDNWKRIAELRQKYDPDKRFHSYLGL